MQIRLSINYERSGGIIASTFNLGVISQLEKKVERLPAEPMQIDLSCRSSILP
jgi:hypothetical protein